jgi:predicted DNA-binding protein with PD1-like motif
VKEWEDKFEIVSATGTVSVDDCHIHIAVADQSGAVIGGHLKSGCIIGTTVELVIATFDDIEYKRAPDVATGYDELLVSTKPIEDGTV